MNTPHDRETATGLRIVALFEASKGLLVMAAGVGLLGLVHRDLQSLAEELVSHFHLNPASRYPQIFFHAVAVLTDSRLWLLAFGALLYASIRLVEAYGLWRQKHWAEWLGILSGGIYLPIEIYELLEGVSWAKAVLILVNGFIVAYLGHELRRSRQERLKST